MKRFCLAALLPLMVAAPAAHAQGNAALTQRLDSIAGYWVQRSLAVGIVAAVVQGDDTLLFKSYGRADVEWDVPMPLDAMFEIGSMTKQFTAVAVLQLRDGPDLVSDWFRRNMRIYSNVLRLIDSANERVLVSFGSGHLGWLRHNFATDPDIHLRKLAEFAVPERREPTGGMAR